MPLHIAQIGSSFASGPDIPPIINSKAKRSGSNFASLVSKRLDAKLTDLASSGATLLQLISEPQDDFPPQIEGLPADADVVLVLGGGNDIGYIGGFFEDTLGASVLSPLVRLVAKVVGKGAPSNPPLDVDTLAARYGTVLDAVHAKAPKAQVLVVEYLAMLGPDVRPSGGDVAFSAERVEYHRGVAAKLLEATAKAADAPERKEWCARVSVDEPSRAHGIGSKEPWVNGFSWRLFRAGAAFHPNAEGMKAVGELVYQKFVELGLVKKAGEEA